MSGAVMTAAETLPWRCFHCDEVFADRKLAEDHFGLITLHPAACVDPLRDNERAMRERAMFYERAWREALQQRDEARAASCDTHPKGGDVKQAPSLMGSAVPSETSADAQEQPLEPKD